MSASRQLAAALRSLRATRTQIRYAGSLNAATDDVRRLMAIHLRELAGIEGDLCATLARAIDDDKAKPWKRVALVEQRLRGGQ